MSNENTTVTAPAATFAKFLIERNERNDEINNFHCAFGDHGLHFPASAAEFVEAVSVGMSGDHDVQWNVEMLAHNMRAASDYLFMALAEHRKNTQGEAV